MVHLESFWLTFCILAYRNQFLLTNNSKIVRLIWEEMQQDLVDPNQQ